MSVIETLLSDIDAAVRGKGERRRHALLRKTTATLIDQLSDLSDHHLAIFDDVLLSLASEVETETRADLSERLADLHRGPKKTLRALALDASITVARPVITRSLCLDDDTLLAIARDKAKEFLVLLVERRNVPDAICDAVIERADDHLLLAIARNDALPISDKALRLLAERALHYQPLYRILRTRPDLSLRHIGAMIEAARQRSHADHDRSDDDHLSSALARDHAALIAKDNQNSLPINSIGNQIGIDHSQHDAVQFADLIDRNQIDEALIALAQRCSLSPDSMKRVFNAPHHEPFFFLMRAQDLPWETARRFMIHKHGMLSDAFETELSKAYCTLAGETAKRIASFMAERKTGLSDEHDVLEPLRHSA